MSDVKPQKRIRRTQAERTASMRLRLAQAVLETLCEVGYDRLSTGLVAQRARASRGALSHHFPSKVDMLVGSFEHLLTEWERERMAFVARYDTPIPFADYLRHLWYDVFQKPTYVACIELMMAARSDAVLQERLRSVLSVWVKKRDALWAYVVGYDDMGALGPAIGRENFFHLNLSVLRGMAIHASFNLDDTVNDRLLEAWITLAESCVETASAKAAGARREAASTGEKAARIAAKVAPRAKARARATAGGGS
ncbi:Bacterial regulatory proteins, tetR family [bacterium YEK0313]|nr:Bacterial regulatory proteins, tetR family [bacterium YEK0313]